jgi:hypothetical protein
MQQLARILSPTTPVDQPDGQISHIPVQPLSKKYSGSLPTQITSLSAAIPCPLRGAYRDRHGRWARDAVDAAAAGAILVARTNDAFADGEVVWS